MKKLLCIILAFSFCIVSSAETGYNEKIQGLSISYASTDDSAKNQGSSISYASTDDNVKSQGLSICYASTDDDAKHQTQEGYSFTVHANEEQLKIINNLKGKKMTRLEFYQAVFPDIAAKLSDSQKKRFASEPFEVPDPSKETINKTN